jgi:polyphosphate kinase
MQPSSKQPGQAPAGTTKSKQASAFHGPVDGTYRFFSRELSWLEFNERVLSEAIDQRTPLLERLKFLAIFSSNLDEFFMVRVAALWRKLDAGVEVLSPDGRTPRQQLEVIRDRLAPMVQKMHRYFLQDLKPQLAESNIQLLDYSELDSEQRSYLDIYFETQIFPVLTPLAVDPGHPFPRISNLSLNLAVLVQDPDNQTELFARIKVPEMLPRFVELPAAICLGEQGAPVIWAGVPLEQVISHSLDALFPGLKVQECHPFRVTRDGDLELEEDEADDLMVAIEQELRRQRKGGDAVRLEVPCSISDTVLQMLLRELELEPGDVYYLDGPLGLRDCFALVGLPLPQAKDPHWSPVTPLPFQRIQPIATTGSDENEDIFALIRRQDLLVHHPYQSFSATVQRFITHAAHDADVLAIKITLYRTSGDSPIVKSLIAAAENGKQVVALVELKARFDEANNINWARQLEQAGVHVVYGLVGLKTHTKITMVVRREAGTIRRYVHIGTGNYNPKTARLYTDVGLLSCREELGADLTDLFNYLTGHSRQQTYRKLLVAPVNLRSRMIALIRREIDHVRSGRDGRIVAKMNALVDPEIILALYEASQAGVSIDLIIRGMCCLRPGVLGLSDRIRVISIIGRFLEHSRLFYFYNGGQVDIYIGSADWMPRNLNRRVEAIVPIEDPRLSEDLQEILAVMLADNRQAWDLQSDGHYIQRRPATNEMERSSQRTLMDLALQSATHLP